MTTLPPPQAAVAKRRTARLTIKDCEAALAAAFVNDVALLAALVDRESE